MFSCTWGGLNEDVFQVFAGCSYVMRVWQTFIPLLQETFENFIFQLSDLAIGLTTMPIIIIQTLFIYPQCGFAESLVAQVCNQIWRPPDDRGRNPDNKITNKVYSLKSVQNYAKGKTTLKPFPKGLLLQCKRQAFWEYNSSYKYSRLSVARTPLNSYSAQKPLGHWLSRTVSSGPFRTVPIGMATR